MSTTSILKKPATTSSALVVKKVRFTDETNKEEDQLYRPHARYERRGYYYSPGKYAPDDAIAGDGHNMPLQIVRFPCVLVGRYHRRKSQRKRCSSCIPNLSLTSVITPLEPTSGERASRWPPLLKSGWETLPSIDLTLEPMLGNLPGGWPPQPSDLDDLSREPVIAQTPSAPIAAVPGSVTGPLASSAPSPAPLQLPPPLNNSMARFLSELMERKKQQPIGCSCVVPSCLQVFPSEREMMRHVTRDHPLPSPTDEGLNSFMDSL